MLEDMKADVLKDWWIRHPSQNEYWMETGEIPDGMFGIKKWVPVYKGFYEGDDRSQG